MKKRTLLLSGCCLAWTLTVSAGTGQVEPRQPHTFLKKYVGFTESEFQDLRQGKVVAKVLETDQKTEVAVFGIVRIEAPIESFVRWQRDIEQFEKGDAVKAIKKISRPPQLSDFDTLMFPEKDLDAFPECKPGKCDVKIDAERMGRIQTEVDWSAPDAHEQANRLVRQMVLEYTKEYIRDGDEALGVLRDKKRPTFIKKEFDGLLDDSPYLVQYVPEFHDYLEKYPHADLPRAEDFLYWSKVQFGLRPTVRLNHVVIYPLGEGKDATVVVGSKMLYASHYFHTALELKILVKDAARPDANGFYLLVLNRSRSDGLTGLFGGIVRSKGQSEARKGTESALEAAREVLEASHRGQGTK